MSEIINKLSLDKLHIYKMHVIENTYILKKEKNTNHHAMKEMLEILSKLDLMGIQYKIDAEMNIELIFE